MAAPLRIPYRLDAAWVADSLNRADAILAAAPRRAHQVRVRPRGTLVQRFVLPLDLCPPQNRTRQGQAWRLAKVKRDLLLVMLVQAGSRRAAPLPGRPFVRCVRFSAVEPDRFADWAKMPVDRLVQSKRTAKRSRDGLGYLVDDRPSCAEVVQSWEYAPKGAGFALIEVWTGDSRAHDQEERQR